MTYLKHSFAFRNPFTLKLPESLGINSTTTYHERSSKFYLSSKLIEPVFIQKHMGRFEQFSWLSKMDYTTHQISAYGLLAFTHPVIRPAFYYKVHSRSSTSLQPCKGPLSIATFKTRESKSETTLCSGFWETTIMWSCQFKVLLINTLLKIRIWAGLKNWINLVFQKSDVAISNAKYSSFHVRTKSWNTVSQLSTP
jgi:hypothetical protein